MAIIALVVSYLWASLRETLPSTSEEAGPFTAGLVWAFIVHWTVLALVTWASCAQRGGC
jgi:hypothetical protein